MANYRYLTTNLLTNSVIAELPFTGVTWGQALNQAGNFSGHMMLSDARIQNVLGTFSSSNTFTLDYVTTPARTGLYVERDGVIVWGGVIWSRSYDSTSQTMTIGAREFESYLDRRRVNTTTVFAGGTDIFTVVKTLVDSANAVTYGNVGISTSNVGTSGVTLPNDYPIFDYQRRNLLDVVTEFSRQGSPYGFDFNISCAYDNLYNLTRSLNLYSPRKGVSASASASLPMLEFPTGIIRYSYPEDGATLTNQLYGMGRGSTDYMYIASSSVTSSFSQGYPLLEDVASYTQIPDPTLTDKMTAAEAVTRSLPVVVLTAAWVLTTDNVEYVINGTTFNASTYVAPNFGEFNLGDTFRIRITDDRFPNTLDTTLRLSKFDVSVGDNGSAEIVQGSFVIGTY